MLRCTSKTLDQLVLYSDPNRNSYSLSRGVLKLVETTYSGPYKVVKRTPKVCTLKIDDKQHTVSIDHLKPCLFVSGRSYYDPPGFRNWFEKIWNADESDIDNSDFENDENDDDVQDFSFASLDLQYDSSFEEEKK
ncbi:hypothetical protein NPIL_344141 [Nephila pilipes]|uniref:Uncharacterized protein n=1 Tax=Nephila pilipes TaxID=299642 RepID=A0A8X6PQ15_NEPPI|nr:hypothetical protein NPIL_344141 [Nephila pilipes]